MGAAKTKKYRDYKILFFGVITFYSLMTFDLKAVREGDLFALLKLALGVLAMIALVRFNLQRMQNKAPKD